MQISITKKVDIPVETRGCAALVSIVYDNHNKKLHLKVDNIHHRDVPVLLNEVSNLLTGALGPNSLIEGISISKMETEHAAAHS
jgi:hypothetical protein